MTGEFYTKKEHFPGFAWPFVFNAEILLKFVVTSFDYPGIYVHYLTDVCCYILRGSVVLVSELAVI